MYKLLFLSAWMFLVSSNFVTTHGSDMNGRANNSEKMNDDISTLNMKQFSQNTQDDQDMDDQKEEDQDAQEDDD